MKTKLKPIRVTTLKEDFVKQFENLILSGNINVGERLPSERELAEQMEVSRPVVHDGLLELSQKGLITIRPRHGSIVNDYRKSGSVELLNSLLHFSQGKLGPEILKGIEELRLVVEKEGLEFLLEQDKTYIQTCIKELTTSVNRSESLSVSGKSLLAEEDFNFHHCLLLFSGNIIYPLLLNSFKEAFINILSEYFSNSFLIEKITKNKKELIKSISQNNIKEAEKQLAILCKTTTYIKNLTNAEKKEG